MTTAPDGLRHSDRENIMFVSIKNLKNTIQVNTQYNPNFIYEAKQIGGRFNGDTKCWEFDIRNQELVKKILLSIFGTDGRNNNLVDVVIKVNKKLTSEREPIYLAGRMIAQARGRDTGATIADGVAFINKKPQSGGSRQYWTTEITQDSIFKIFDLPEGALKLLDEYESIEYEVISKRFSKEDELIQLKAELELITNRIAELEAIH